MQRCQIKYLGSKAHTLFSSKWQRCLSHIQQFDAFFSAHSAKKYKETVFIHFRVHTYIITSCSVNCSCVSLCDLPLLQTNHGIWPAPYRSPAPTRQYATFKDRGGYYSMVTYTIPSTTRIKASPKNAENERNADGNSKKRFLFAGTYHNNHFRTKSNRNKGPCGVTTSYLGTRR